MTDIKSGQLAREALSAGTGGLRAVQVAREVLRSEAGTVGALIASQVAREVLSAGTGRLYVGQVAREVLHSTLVPSGGRRSKLLMAGF
jgi:hypothetical protein